MTDSINSTNATKNHRVRETAGAAGARVRSIVRTDVPEPQGMDLDNPHEEAIQGVVTLTLSEYSVTASICGKTPSIEDIRRLLAAGSGDAYKDAWDQA